jgi:hypothetical protein
VNEAHVDMVRVTAMLLELTLAVHSTNRCPWFNFALGVASPSDSPQIYKRVLQAELLDHHLNQKVQCSRGVSHDFSLLKQHTSNQGS